MTFYNIPEGDLTVEWDKKTKKLTITAPPRTRVSEQRDNRDEMPVVVTLSPMDQR